VATIVGSLQSQVSFAEYRLFLKGSFAKETYNFKEPTKSEQIHIQNCVNDGCHNVYSPPLSSDNMAREAVTGSSISR